jgi:hypothetical protein
MKKSIKTFGIIFIAIVLLGTILFFLNRLNESRLQKASKAVWEQFLTKTGQEKHSFGCNVNVIAKEKGKEKYTQNINTGYQEDSKLKGTYQFKNDKLTIEKQFITLGDITYSEEGKDKKWFIWATKSYPESKYYTPKQIVEALDMSSIRFDNRKKGLFFYHGYLKTPIENDDLGIASIKIVVDGKDKFIKQIELVGRQNNIIITKKVTFSDYDKVFDINKPDDKDIVK